MEKEQKKANLAVVKSTHDLELLDNVPEAHEVPKLESEVQEVLETIEDEGVISPDSPQYKEEIAKIPVRAQIFGYRGYVGCTNHIEEGKFLNNPKEAGQLGVVIDVKEVDINQEAIDIIKQKHQREGGSFAPIMLTKHDDGEASVAIMGFWRALLANIEDNPTIGRDCDLEVLNLCTLVENNVPEDFKNYVDSELGPVQEEKPEEN